MENKRIITVKPPVIVYENIEERLPEKISIEKFKELLQDTSKLLGMDRNQRVYYSEVIPTYGMSFSKERLLRKRSEFNRKVPLKRIDVQLESKKNNRQNSPNYQQILNKISSRLIHHHRDLGGRFSRKRNNSNDLLIIDRIQTPINLYLNEFQAPKYQYHIFKAKRNNSSVINSSKS